MLDQFSGGLKFEYQKRDFTFNKATGLFEKLILPTNLSFKTYLEEAIATTRDENWVEEQTLKFSQNEFDIPLPTFKVPFLPISFANSSRNSTLNTH